MPAVNAMKHACVRPIHMTITYVLMTKGLICAMHTVAKHVLFCRILSNAIVSHSD